jgi:hypothetical protein
MKKVITIACLIASSLLIFDSMGIWYMLMMFFVVGLIPGTDIIIAPSIMIILIAVLFGVVVGKTFIVPIVRKYNPNLQQINIKIKKPVT